MFSRVPREFGKTRTVVTTRKQFLSYINLYNTRLDCFTTTYDFGKTLEDGGLDKSSIIIPHVPFDLDSENCFTDMMKLHNFCKTENLSHIINCSGRGYHIYILVEEDKINTILDVLMYQNQLIAQLELDVDCTCIGNPSHLIRIPGTYNPKRKHWCIGLKEEELTTHEEILKLAETQRAKTFILKGEKLLLPHFKSSDVIPDNPLYASNCKMDINTGMLIPCLCTNIRPGGYIPHKERVWIAQYLSELYRGGRSPDTLTDEEIEEITNKITQFFSTIILDYNIEKTKYYVNGIVRSYDLGPSCPTLKAQGKCVANQCWRRDF